MDIENESKNNGSVLTRIVKRGIIKNERRIFMYGFTYAFAVCKSSRE